MNKIASGFIGGTILFLILNFIVKPLIEKKEVNTENLLEQCEKMNLSNKVENNFLSDLCKKKMDISSQKQQEQSQKKVIEMLKKGSK